MNELQIFQNPEFGEIRTIEENGKVLFCGTDVAKALGYKNPTKAIADHCKGTVERRANDSLGRQQNMKFIPEGDIYRLAAKSELPSAERFESWIFDEVLPSIRKTGGYIMGQEEMSDLELLSRAVLVAQNQIAQRDAKISELHAENCMKDQVIADFAPIRSYVDQILDSPGTMATSQIAADYNISARKLNCILHEERIQRNVNGQWILYKEHMGKGYTKSKTFQFTHSDGRQDSKMQTQWTQKGRLMIHEILKKRGILPLIEMKS